MKYGKILIIAFLLATGIIFLGAANAQSVSPALQKVKEVNASTTPSFSGICSATIDSHGDILIGDPATGSIRELYANGTMATIASGFSFGTGYFSYVGGLVVDSHDNIIVADSDHSAVKKISPDGTVTTLASGFTPLRVTVDARDNVYVTDLTNGAVKKISTDGTVSTVATGFLYPYGIAVDAAGNIYVSEHHEFGYTGLGEVDKIAPDGTKTTVGSGFGQPKGLAVDAQGNVFVIDWFHSALKEVCANGTIINLYGAYYPEDVAVNSAGQVVYVDSIAVREFAPAAPAGTVVLSFVPNSTSTMSGTSKTVDIVADSLPAGMAGYDLTLSVDTPGVASITGVAFPAWAAQLNGNSALPSNVVKINAVDLDKQLVNGGTNVVLATVTLQGNTVGSTGLTISQARLDFYEGSSLNTEATTGSLKVTSYVEVFPGCYQLPRDLTGNGHFMDINGNGRLDFGDVVTYYQNLDWIRANAKVGTVPYDYNNNEVIDFQDLVDLYKAVSG